jgi:hypothetical protein
MWLAVAGVMGALLAALVAWMLLRSRREAARAGGVVDEDVHFTVYRPVRLVPAHWTSVLAFAHHSAPGSGPGGVDPVAEVHRQAAAVLDEGGRHFAAVSEDSAAGLPLGSEVTFALVMPGCEVNPPKQTFTWSEPMHREEFRVRAGGALAGTTVRGHLAVYQGVVLVAEVNVGVRVATAAEAAGEGAASDGDRVSSRHYDRVFMSYSHFDREIVERVEAYNVLDVDYLRDCRDLRAGELWSDRLEDLIAGADRFELFWSTNAMASDQVTREWRYALALGRPDFVRPVYWQEPRPSSPDRGLPPPELDCLHFQYLPVVDREAHAAPLPPPLGATAAAGALPPPGPLPPPPGPLPPTPVPEAQASPPPSGPRHAAPRRGRRLPVLAGAGVVAAAVIVAGAVALTSNGNAGTEDVALDTTVPGDGTAGPPPTSTGGTPSTPPATARPGESVPQSYGDDPALDRLSDACGAGTMRACDALSAAAAPGTQYASWAASCGGRSKDPIPGECVTTYGPEVTTTAPTTTTLTTSTLERPPGHRQPPSTPPGPAATP